MRSRETIQAEIDHLENTPYIDTVVMGAVAHELVKLKDEFKVAPTQTEIDSIPEIIVLFNKVAAHKGWPAADNVFFHDWPMAWIMGGHGDIKVGKTLTEALEWLRSEVEKLPA